MTQSPIKLHTLFSLNDFLPIDVHVSDGKISDNIGAYHLMPPGRSIIVADRGYDDTQLWRDWDSRGVSFIVRLRRDIKFTRKEDFAQPDDREQDILVDEAIELVGDDTSKTILTLCVALWFTARMTLPDVKPVRMRMNTLLRSIR